MVFTKAESFILLVQSNCCLSVNKGICPPMFSLFISFLDLIENKLIESLVLGEKTISGLSSSAGLLHQRPPRTIQSQYCTTMQQTMTAYIFCISRLGSSISATLLHISFDYIRGVKSRSNIPQHGNQLHK